METTAKLRINRKRWVHGTVLTKDTGKSCVIGHAARAVGYTNEEIRRYGSSIFESYVTKPRRRIHNKALWGSLKNSNVVNLLMDVNDNYYTVADVEAPLVQRGRECGIEIEFYG